MTKIKYFGIIAAVFLISLAICVNIASSFYFNPFSSPSHTKLPDFKAVNISYSPSKPFEGENINVSCMVEILNYDKSVPVQFYLTKGPIVAKIGRVLINKTGYVNISFRTKDIPYENMTLLAWIDPDNQIKESNEVNNVVEKDIYIRDLLYHLKKNDCRNCS